MFESVDLKGLTHQFQSSFVGTCFVWRLLNWHGRITSMLNAFTCFLPVCNFHDWNIFLEYICSCFLILILPLSTFSIGNVVLVNHITKKELECTYTMFVFPWVVIRLVEAEKASLDTQLISKHRNIYFALIFK